MSDDLKNSSVGRPPSPIFITGCHRTGTTLVRRILNSHSRLEIYHESHYYPYFYREINFYGDLRRSANLIRFINELIKVVHIQRLNPDMDVLEIDEFLEELVAPTFEGVFSTMLHLYAKKRGKVRGGDKTPRHYAYLSDILEKFPDSPVIFLMRDPRDTVLSIQKQFDTSIEGSTKIWNDALLHYQQFAKSVHLVRYEELVEKPAEVIEEMCKFIGEPYEDSMLRFFEKPPEHILAQKGGKLLQPLDTGSVGKFQKMPSSEIRQIEADCAYGMQLMGYPFTIFRPKAVEIKPIMDSSFLHFLMDRLRYYGINLGRWKHGWMRWRSILSVRIRYLLLLGPFRKDW